MHFGTRERERGGKKLDEILKKGEGREGGRGLRKGSGGAAGAAEAEQSWRPPKKWTHSSCVQKWEGEREREEEEAAPLVARSVR